MNIYEQTTQQLERAIKKIAQHFPLSNNCDIITDLHLFISPESGDLIVYDDNDKEITRCVIDEWIENKDQNFYHHITAILRDILRKMKETVDNLGIMKPYSFVLQNEDKEDLAELYLADDDTVILGGDLMEGLEKDLDDFLNHLLDEQ